jgi:lipid II:glycine glycyltransferase (peptidoglycan interpeptide bridge formation enzyme)
MILLKDSEIDREKWNIFLRENNYSTPFQSPAFLDFYNSVPNYSAEVFATEENNEIQALCLVTFQKESGIKGYFSRRAIIYGGPLIREGNSESFVFLLHQLTEYVRRKTIYIEIRNYHDYNQYRSIFEKEIWMYLPYYNFQLNLKEQTIENALASMQYNRRREIKKTLEEGALYSECKTDEQLSELYQILKNLYKLRVSSPLPPLIYFITLFHSKISKVFIVWHHERMIGGSICIVLPNCSIYTMYYCGLRDYHPKIFPAHLAVLAVIEYAINNKIPVLDLMGAGKVGVKYGVRDYKAKFGGKQIEYGRFLKVNNPILYSIGRIGLKILSKIK